MIKLIQTLDEFELKKCQNIILSLEKDYESFQNFQFKTLGGASYLHYGHEHEDNNHTPEIYENIKNRCNPILIKNFIWLYEIIKKTLNKKLKEECDISEKANMAYTRFHIFNTYENCEYVCHPAHLDYQWQYHLENLKKIFKTVDQEKFLTFTLSILLPKNGAGLYYWPLPNQDEQYSFSEAEIFFDPIYGLANELFEKSNKNNLYVSQ